MSDTSGWGSPALLAAIVAAGAAWLSYRKLKLDLFEKRYAAYEEVAIQATARMSAVKSTQPGAPPPIESLNAFHSAGSKIKFLFDPAVHRLYLKVDQALNEFTLSHWHRESCLDDEITEAINRNSASHMAVINSMNEFRRACSPALRQYSLLWHRPEEFIVSTYHDIDRWLETMVYGFAKLCRHIWGSLKS